MRRPFALLTMSLVLSGCGPKVACDKPDEVVSSFYTSLTYGDTATAFQLLTGADRRALTDRAMEASKVTGKKMSGEDMLVPGLVQLPGELGGATFAPVKVEVGDVREVQVSFADGTVVKTPVVREASCYRIPLGL